MSRPGRFILAMAACASVGLPAASGAQALDWPRESPPPPLSAKSVSFPPYQLKTLSNGLQVVVVPHHEQPSVSFRMLIRAGAMQEPSDKPGVASFVASLLDQGTTTKTSEEIANLIDSAGAVVGSSAGNELTFVNGAVVKDQTEFALGIVSDMVQRPVFAQTEIDRQKLKSLSSLQVAYDDPEYIANLVFDRLIFGFHPYGRPNEGTPESIPKITREDLVAFHRAWFVPNNTLLAIVGDLTAPEAFAAAEKAFGGWVRREVPAVKVVDPPPMTRRLVVVDRPGSAQTEIRVGQLAIQRTDPDFIPFDMTVRILGGEGANRLFGVLRSDRGLTYGASAAFRTYKNAGELVAETDTRSATTGESLRLMVAEFVRIQRESVNPAELRGAQDFMAGNFPLTIETPAAIAEQVLARLFYGQDLSEISTYLERVGRVTPGDIQRVARQFIKPDQLSIVLVGDAAAFVDQLKAAGYGDFERIPVSQLDMNSPTLRRGRAPAAPPPGGTDTRPVRDPLPPV
jgi:zinc protease